MSAGSPNLRDVDVLVVEDQESVVRVLRRILKPSEARVTTASTLADAQVALRGGWHYGVILLDQKLPDGDALNLLDELHDHEIKPAIVATSGNLQESKRSLRLQEYGAVLLPKPFTSDDLLSAIRTAMETRERERRQSSLPPAGTETGRVLCHGPIALDLLMQSVRVDGALVDLQPTQFRLLATLIAHVGKSFSPEELVEATLRGSHQSGGVNIRFQIHTLRRRLGDAGVLIETTRRGYGIGVGDAAKP